MWSEDDDGHEQTRAPDPEYAEKRRIALEKIEEAFGALSRPRVQALREGLSQYAALDQLVTELGQRSWQDIPVEPLRLHRDALPMMGAEALRFVLPAYLRACLIPSPARDDLLEYTLRVLSPERERGGLAPKAERAAAARARHRVQYDQRIAVLSAPQRGAIRAFIRALRAEDPAAWWCRSPAMKEWDAGGCSL